MKAPKSGNWIAGAIKQPGALRATAKSQGLITGSQLLSGSDLTTLKSQGGKTAERANLAKTLKGFKK